MSVVNPSSGRNGNSKSKSLLWIGGSCVFCISVSAFLFDRSITLSKENVNNLDKCVDIQYQAIKRELSENQQIIREIQRDIKSLLLRKN